MKATLTALCFVMILALAAGCGSPLSAPPLDLPAPVVGRITVGTPDSSGKVLITGSEGAVPANAIVLAINERLEASASLWKVTDFLISSAYAQILPTVCSDIGHVCALAASDGSFMLTIDAIIGDSIVLVLIDAEGNEISPRVSFIVPATTLAATSCAGLGRTGLLVDLYNFRGDAVTLHEGSDTSGNKVSLNGSSLAIPGCFAVDLEVIPAGTDSGAVAVISDQDRIAWIGHWSASRFLYANTFAFEETPLALAYIGSATHVAIAFETASGLAVGRLSLESGAIDNVVNLPMTPPFQFDALIAMRSIGPFTDGGYLVALIFAGSDGGVTNYFVHFIEAVNFKLASRDATAVNLNAHLNLTDIMPADAVLTIGNVSTKIASILMTDRGTGFLRDVQLQTPGQLLQLSMMRADSLANSVSLSQVFNYVSAPLDITLGRLDVGFSSGALPSIVPVAYVLGGASVLWTVTDFAETTYRETLNTLLAAEAVLIAVDSEAESIIVGDALTNDYVLSNAYWYDAP